MSQTSDKKTMIIRNNLNKQTKLKIIKFSNRAVVNLQNDTGSTRVGVKNNDQGSQMQCVVQCCAKMSNEQQMAEKVSFMTKRIMKKKREGMHVSFKKSKYQVKKQKMVQRMKHYKHLRDSLQYILGQEKNKRDQNKKNNYSLVNQKLKVIDKRRVLEYLGCWKKSMIQQKFSHRNRDIVIKEKYKINSLIGKGGFSEVMDGQDLLNNRQVVFKITKVDNMWTADKKRQFINIIQNEIKVIQELQNCKNIVKYYDHVVVDDLYIIVMEYLKGKTLDYKVFRDVRSAMFKQTLLMIAQQIQTLHLNHYIHYDLKPGNIMFTDDKQIYLLDFGISKKIRHGQQIKLVYNGEGTLQYQPPECFQYCLEVDEFGNDCKYITVNEKVDIWAYGCIIYQLVYGVNPYFEAMNYSQIIQNNVQMFRKELDLNLEDEQLQMLIRNCLQQDPNQRWSIQQVLQSQYFNDDQNCD